METATPGRFEQSMDYLRWCYLAGAVLDVYHENQRREDSGGRPKANADVWCSVDQLREDIHRRACESWCKRAKADRTYWPYSVDAVSRMYFRIRKRPSGEVEAFDAEVVQACNIERPRSLFGRDDS